jgi:hypothetical protein
LLFGCSRWIVIDQKFRLKEDRQMHGGTKGEIKTTAAAAAAAQGDDWSS